MNSDPRPDRITSAIHPILGGYNTFCQSLSYLISVTGYKTDTMNVLASCLYYGQTLVQTKGAFAHSC